MAKYTCDGFQAIQKGAEIDYRVIEHISDAAKVFGDRLARRSGKNNRAVVSQDSYGGNSALYQVEVVEPSGVVKEKNWITVTRE